MKNDPFDGPYLGNIWGWRFSLAGLAIILLMLALMAYRHYTLGVPLIQPAAEESEAPADTAKLGDGNNSGGDFESPPEYAAPADTVKQRDAKLR